MTHGLLVWFGHAFEGERREQKGVPLWGPKGRLNPEPNGTQPNQRTEATKASRVSEKAARGSVVNYFTTRAETKPARRTAQPPTQVTEDEAEAEIVS